MSYSKIYLFFSLCFANTFSAFAATSVSFFSSNNTGFIDAKTAYERLLGKPQDDLANNIVDIMQRNHIEQGKCDDILGTYKIDNFQNITADNTDRYTSSPYQDLSNEKIIDLAKQLAVTLKQESIAVFIPSEKAEIGDIKVSFESSPPTVKELMVILEKLPGSYSQAFSLYLKHNYGDFDKATVTTIEWLGSKINVNLIMNVFPKEKVSIKKGRAILVFKNGQIEDL